MSDYRQSDFRTGELTAYGKVVGKNYYWKIYASENIIRVLIHSVLTVQIGHNWWELAVDKRIRDKAQVTRKTYQDSVPVRNPGNHDIYCSHLPHLERILSVNLNFFRPVIPDIDNIIIGLNEIRVPRNLTGHMNVLDTASRQSIGRFYKLCAETIANLKKTQSIELIYPR